MDTSIRLRHGYHEPSVRFWLILSMPISNPSWIGSNLIIFNKVGKLRSNAKQLRKFNHFQKMPDDLNRSSPEHCGHASIGLPGVSQVPAETKSSVCRFGFFASTTTAASVKSPPRSSSLPPPLWKKSRSPRSPYCFPVLLRHSGRGILTMDH